jgi:hypothetical protein
MRGGMETNRQPLWNINPWVTWRIFSSGHLRNKPDPCNGNRELSCLKYWLFDFPGFPV